MLCILASLLTSCGKDGGVCFSSSGPVTRQQRYPGAFTRVSVNDNVTLILTPDLSGPVVVEAGEQLLGGIHTTVSEGQLTLSNSNTCNWLRDYGKEVRVHVPAGAIHKVRYNGSGDIRTTGRLKLDSLTVEVWGGCGTVDLDLDLWKGNFSLNLGTVDLRLRGVSAITSVLSAGYGLYDGRSLETGYTFITSRATNDCYVNAKNALEARIESIGNIYYSGSPASVQATVTGQGRLIPN